MRARGVNWLNALTESMYIHLTPAELSEKPDTRRSVLILPAWFFQESGSETRLKGGSHAWKHKNNYKFLSDLKARNTNTSSYRQKQKLSTE